jgi:endonuclease YncB( thermonuclease family)
MIKSIALGTAAGGALLMGLMPTCGAPAPTALPTVTKIVDGDTLDLSNGARVRIIGIDTPERGQCGFAEAKARLSQLVLRRTVHAPNGAATDADRYGRALRYIDSDGIGDAGLVLLNEGLAHARYDSRDGYGTHPREAGYIAADAATRNVCE